MPRINLAQLQRPNDAVRTAVGSYLSDMPLYLRVDNDNGVLDESRADANETAMLATALTQTALEAIEADYPENRFRDAAPLQQGIAEGADNFTWDEYDTVGMAKIISNGSDDIPNVSQYIKTNEGKVESYAIAYSYTDQDVRRAAFARQSGRQAIVLSPDKAIEARAVVERTKDRDAAFGDPKYSIPGFFRSSNVSMITASAPAAGTSRAWDGGDKTGIENLADLRLGVRTVATVSKGSQFCDTVAMSIELAEFLATQPLMPDNENQITVLAEFLRAQREIGRPITVIAWNRARTADAAGTGDRVVFYRRSPQVLALVEPMILRATAPERRGLATHVVNETRFGGIFWKKPLGGLYMDFADP